MEVAHRLTVWETLGAGQARLETSSKSCLHSACSSNLGISCKSTLTEQISLEIDLLQFVRDRGDVIHSLLIITLQALVSQDLSDSPPNCNPRLIKPCQVQSFILRVRQADGSEYIMGLSSGVDRWTLYSPDMRIFIKVHRSLQHQQTNVELDLALTSPDEEVRMGPDLSGDGLADKCSALCIIGEVMLSCQTPA